MSDNDPTTQSAASDFVTFLHDELARLPSGNARRPLLLLALALVIDESPF